MTARHPHRRGFSLLEVMVSLAILVVSMTILMETQNTAVKMTREAERVVTGTHLAQEKLNEVLLQVEEEGFGDQDIEEHGDFKDFGSEELDLKMGQALDDYYYAWSVLEIDLGLAGDIAGMGESMAGSGYWGESQPEVQSNAAGGGAPDLSALGVSNEMITEMLGAYIREARVVVWWGTEDLKLAEERGDQVILTTHVINPTGQIIPGGDAIQQDNP
ncbi:MAG: prepilin-type N-terminal cleavage/methylation domain-containing protein [Deltaproteobacteria bacterium]|nr:prepilin-type N-terminal cleavage/methylation domain-containing protein [Deltaproteobacteria bacterium]